MRKTIVAELLRSVSGLSFLAVVLFLFLIPFFVLIQTNDMDSFASMSDLEASRAFYRPVGAGFITTAFLASYAVTREFYYQSIDRSLIQAGTWRLLLSKMVASSITGLGLALLLAVVWPLIGSWWFSTMGHTFVLDQGTFTVGLGTLLSCLPASAFGCLLGWAIRNYYVTTAVVFVLPLAVEFPLRAAAPDLAKLLPNNALSGLAGFTAQDSTLGWWSCLLVASAWIVLVAVTVWTLERRRDIR
ncbi:hypothetical protein [Arthrobacter sp. RAF14]|uniref:hypothetical protein n=1 Tax=Arthrobacter sp. RAF14 TaxID=3233051 RepID=UPI003F8FA46C